ncbi:MAG: ISL3 family transposase [Ilumatobacteraceae bacterium]
MSDGIAMVKRLLGLPGMNVLEVTEGDDELVIKVETAETIGWCPGCGVRAQAQDRTTRSVRDLSCFGRAVRLDVWCRRWRCREVLCATKTWTEDVEQLDATAVLTRRAGAEACRQVGQQARPVAAVAREFGVCWWTVMNAVIEHGTPLVDDPDRVGTVTKLGVDETSFQAARPGLATKYVTGLVDLERRAMIDMTAGNRAADLRRWCANADPAWIAKISVVATDLAESYRAGLSPHLDHVTRVADPFHVVRVANRCMDTVRRRVQNEQLGHRGRKRDPLFKIRKILLAGSERVTHGGADRMLLGLRVGDPNDELLGAWLAKESVRDVFLTDDPAEAALLLDKTIAGCLADVVPEIRSLGDTLKRWRTEILAHHTTGASNGPTEGLNLLVKEVKRCGRGFENFEHYRLRVLLRAGKPAWPNRPTPPILRTCRPHAHA